MPIIKNMSISGRDIVKRMAEKKPLKCYEQDLNIPNQTISHWKVADSPPKANELLKIAHYLNVSIEWLLTGQDTNRDELSPSIMRIAAEINKLPDVYKKVVFDMVETLRKSAEENQ